MASFFDFAQHRFFGTAVALFQDFRGLGAQEFGQYLAHDAGVLVVLRLGHDGGGNQAVFFDQDLGVTPPSPVPGNPLVEDFPGAVERIGFPQRDYALKITVRFFQKIPKLQVGGGELEVFQAELAHDLGPQKIERGMKPAKPCRFLVGDALGRDPVAEMPVVLGLEFVAQGELAEIGMGDGVETGPVGLVHLEGGTQAGKHGPGKRSLGRPGGFAFCGRLAAHGCGGRPLDQAISLRAAGLLSRWVTSMIPSVTALL